MLKQHDMGHSVYVGKFGDLADSNVKYVRFKKVCILGDRYQKLNEI